VPGPKLRCDAPRVDPGGGGINVSRLVQRLGGETTAFVALGGGNGQRLLTALEAEGISVRVIPVAGETRASLGVTDRATGAQYRFVLPGPALTEAECRGAIDAIVEEAATGDFVVLSGSLPASAVPGFPRALAAALRDKGTRLVIDTSGEALKDLALRPDPEAAARPAVLRFDHLEAEETAGYALPARADTARFAADLVARGAAGMVVVGRQAEGNLLATPDGVWFASAAPVEVVSTTGAGDSFLAALTYALAIGAAPPEALQWGTAAASAAVTTPATQLCDADTVERLKPDCRVERVEP
jgi:6-phosphofructokinase 2